MADLRIVQSVTDALQTAMLLVLAGGIDAAQEPGTLTMHDGARPSVAGATTQAKTLAVLTFSRPSAAMKGAVLAFNAIAPEVNAPAAGTAKWARIADGAGNAVFDCDVTAEGQGGTIELDRVEIKAGGLVQILSFTLSGA